MARNNVWLSVSDLMTGMMMIFLFIAIAYIKKAQDNQSVLWKFVDNKTELHDKLVESFHSEFKNNTVSIKGDLTMRFENAEVLFEMGSDQLTPEFENTLNEVMPKYLNILLKDSMRYKIKEIRIEGHTDIAAYPALNEDPYMANLILSQRRAYNVLAYIRGMKEYNSFDSLDRQQLDQWFTASGFSYSRALDKDGNYAYVSRKPIDMGKSRRVEIRIITSGEEVLENFLEKQKSNGN